CPILPKPMIPKVLPLSSRPLAKLFFKSLKRRSPSKGMALLASCKNREAPNRCAITNSATDSTEAVGVLITWIPLDLACSTSILSIPTPPLPISRRPGQASMISRSTVVAERTNRPMILLVLIKFASCPWATLVVFTLNPAFPSRSMPCWEIPSLANMTFICSCFVGPPLFWTGNRFVPLVPKSAQYSFGHLGLLFQFTHHIHQDPDTVKGQGIVHGGPVSPHGSVSVDSADPGLPTHFLKGILEGGLIEV